MPDTTALLTSWSSYYVMTGSSAATLTGLMFVVITLVRRAQRQVAQDGISTFSTPTVAHFCAALLISGILSAPWHSLIGPSILIGGTGLYGVIYLVRIMLRTLTLQRYSADLEDWIWYDVLPFFVYVVMFAAAVALHIMPVGSLFALAGTVLALIFIGIRNAWDVVTYIATGQADADLPE